MSQYEQVRDAVELALSHMKAALKTVSEEQPRTEPQDTGLIGSIRATIKRADDPRYAVLTTLRNAVYELQACQAANERTRNSAGT